jgi:hypothetical protein
LRNQYDGFWFPSSVRNAIITPQRQYDYLHFKEGRIVSGADAETITVRWPRLDRSDWKRVIAQLRENRRRVRGPSGSAGSLQALLQMRAMWLDQASPVGQSVLQALAACTGHSPAMLSFALGQLNLISLDELQRVASQRFTQAVKGQFVPLEGLTGRIRFFPDSRWQSLLSRGLLHFDGYRRQPWRQPRRSSDMILGYAAGNVPGTGLLLILLALAAAAEGKAGPPLIVVKNSRREPLFTPLVLTALEVIEPKLLETTLATLWDYTDAALQEYLVGQADLVVAAASDETIDQIGRVVARVTSRSHPIRFHRHGHKVSFSTIGRECLAIRHQEPQQGAALLDVVALLAALDVALWNQQGCLSSRVHFVEQGQGPGYHAAEVYGRAVVEGLRALNVLLPKGIPLRRQIHTLFDKYQAMAPGGAVEVLSSYDDDFAVILDRRPWRAGQFRETVNDCQGRSVVIIPVADVREIAERYLSQVPRQQLQSMSVALGDPAVPGIDSRLLRYAEELGAAGVTAIRTVGRGAFPQLAYSWDGLIPLDLTVKRPRGHYTGLEFGEPWAEIRETYGLVRRAMDAQA